MLAEDRKFALLALGLAAALVACDPTDFDELVGGDERADTGVADGGGGSAGSGSAGSDARVDSSDAAARDSGPVQTPIDAGMDAGDRPDAASPAPDAGEDAAIEGGAGMPDAAPPECPHASDPPSVQPTPTDLGALSIPNVGALGNAFSTGVGGHLLWLFSGPQIATWSTLQPPLTALPELQAPTPLVPLLPSNAVPVNTYPSIGGVVGVNAREALIYIYSGYIFDAYDVGLARIEFDELQAEVVRSAGELFPYRANLEVSPRIWLPLFAAGVFAHKEPDATYIYLYACGPNPSEPSEQPGGENEGPCRVARVPRELAAEGTSYRYWNGSAGSATTARHAW